MAFVLEDRAKRYFSEKAYVRNVVHAYLNEQMEELIGDFPFITHLDVLDVINDTLAYLERSAGKYGKFSAIKDSDIDYMIKREEFLSIPLKKNADSEYQEVFKKVNFYENYGDKSARERAKLIYSNYSSFQGIIEDCKMRLIYEIKAEKERRRSNHKDELGVRIQNMGNYSNPTADEAVLDVMLEGAINGLNSAEDALSDPALVQEFKRREYVIVMMADEYASFRRHLHALSVKEQEIIIPLLKQEKDYYTLAEEAGVTVPVVRRKASRIHCELISYMENYFIEKL